MKSEPLGVVIVESGWGSMVPTVVLANMLPNGPAARCGQLNIGDQIISVNGVSLVGLPLSACQTYIKVLSGSRIFFLYFSLFHAFFLFHSHSLSLYLSPSLSFLFHSLFLGGVGWSSG